MLKFKEKLEKVEEFVMDHYTLFITTMFAGAVIGTSVAVYNTNTKEYKALCASARDDFREALIVAAASGKLTLNSNNED